MNYDQARQRESDGKWDWTTMNDGIIRATASCSSHCGHETQEEAERHFYDYSLDQVKETGVSWTACEYPDCPNPTQRALGNLGFWLALSSTPLCDEHRTKECLVEVYPFHAGMALIHS